MVVYVANRTYPSLTALSGFGSYGRTAQTALLSSPRNKIGSQRRILSWMINNNQGPQYISFLLKSIGPQPFKKYQTTNETRYSMKK